jgi:hypothetical protein
MMVLIGDVKFATKIAHNVWVDNHINGAINVKFYEKNSLINFFMIFLGYEPECIDYCEDNFFRDFQKDYSCQKCQI